MAVGAVRARVGCRERPRGRTDPPGGSPGPPDLTLGGKDREKYFGPSSRSMAVGCDGHFHPVNHGVSLASPVAALAHASQHRSEWAYQAFLDGSEA